MMVVIGVVERFVVKGVMLMVGMTVVALVVYVLVLVVL